MSEYQGHKSWDHWNVSLWINNDESLYRAARDCVKHNRNKTGAADDFIEFLDECGLSKTPDGAPYTMDRVRAAMSDMS